MLLFTTITLPLVTFWLLIATLISASYTTYAVTKYFTIVEFTAHYSYMDDIVDKVNSVAKVSTFITIILILSLVVSLFWL